MKRITNRHRRALMGPPPDPDSVPKTMTRYERLKDAADRLADAISVAVLQERPGGAEFVSQAAVREIRDRLRAYRDVTREEPDG